MWLHVFTESSSFSFLFLFFSPFYPTREQKKSRESRSGGQETGDTKKKIRTTGKRVRCWPPFGCQHLRPCRIVVVESRTELLIVVPNRSPEEAV